MTRKSPTYVAVIAAVGYWALTPSNTAIAADVKCDNATVSAVQAKMDSITDTDQKKMASDHLMMAEASMKSGKLDDCKLHLDEAMKSLGSM